MKNFKSLAIVVLFLFTGSSNLLFARKVPAQVAVEGKLSSTNPISPDGTKFAATDQVENKVYIYSALDGSLLETFNVNDPRAFYWNKNSRSLIVQNIANKKLNVNLINLSK